MYNDIPFQVNFHNIYIGLQYKAYQPKALWLLEDEPLPFPFDDPFPLPFEGYENEPPFPLLAPFPFPLLFFVA